MKTCSKCKIEKDPIEFNFKKKALNQRQSACKSCTRSAIRNHYTQNKDYYLKKSKTRNVSNRGKIQKYVLDYLLNNPCIDCGETDPVVLEFDHFENKEANVSRLIKGNHSLIKVKSEIKKCDVRCANCHRRKTAKHFNWYKIIPMHP